jgi:hypothetical protein
MLETILAAENMILAAIRVRAENIQPLQVQKRMAPAAVCWHPKDERRLGGLFYFIALATI